MTLFVHQLKQMKNQSFNNTHEYTILQTDLLEEKRKHLETVKELSSCQTKLKELEELIDARLSEAILELNEKQTLIDDLQKVCYVYSFGYKCIIAVEFGGGRQ